MQIFCTHIASEEFQLDHDDNKLEATTNKMCFQSATKTVETRKCKKGSYRLEVVNDGDLDRDVRNDQINN